MDWEELAAPTLRICLSGARRSSGWDFPALNNSGTGVSVIPEASFQPPRAPGPRSGYSGKAPGAAAQSAAPGGKTPILFPVPRENRTIPTPLGGKFPWKTSGEHKPGVRSWFSLENIPVFPAVPAAGAGNSAGFDPAVDPCFPPGFLIRPNSIGVVRGRERPPREIGALGNVPPVPAFPGFAREKEEAAPSSGIPRFLRDPAIPLGSSILHQIPNPGEPFRFKPQFSLSAPIPENPSDKTTHE